MCRAPLTLAVAAAARSSRGGWRRHARARLPARRSRDDGRCRCVRQPIDAENEAHVEIDTVCGTLNFGGGAIDVSVPARIPSPDRVLVATSTYVHRLSGTASRCLPSATSSARSRRPRSLRRNLHADEAWLLGGGVGGASLGIIDNSLVDAIQTAFAGFSGVAPSIGCASSNTPAGIVHFRPGVEIEYQRDITINVANDGTTEPPVRTLPPALRMMTWLSRRSRRNRKLS